MSRKPTIQIKYPDASTLAMQLTDAMIRRAPGKRVVETTSEDKTGTGEGSLLGHLDIVRTSTGVEMTLTLEPASMDYALTQLIRPNLTSEEKTAIFGEAENELDLGESPRAGQAAGASACTNAVATPREATGGETCTDEVDSASRAADGSANAEREPAIRVNEQDLRDILADLQDGKTSIDEALEDLNDCFGVTETVEVGKIRDEELRRTLTGMIDKYRYSLPEYEPNLIDQLIQETINEINYAAGVIEVETECIESNELTDMLAVLVTFSLHTLGQKKTEQLREFAKHIYGHINDLSGISKFEQFCVPVSVLWDSIVDADNAFNISKTLKPFDKFDAMRKQAGYVPDTVFPNNQTDQEQGELTWDDDDSGDMAPAEEVIGHDE